MLAVTGIPYRTSMRVPRFIWPDSQNVITLQRSQEITLTGDNFHHLSHVLRLKAGECIEIINHAAGQIYRCNLQQVSTTTAVAKIEGVEVLPSVPPLTLLVGTTKPSTCDFILEKSIEIGVSRVCFFAATRSQEGNKRLINRLDRFERVIEGATKQSGGTATKGQVLLFSSLKEALNLLHPSAKVGVTSGHCRFLLKQSAPPLLNLTTISHWNDSAIPGEESTQLRTRGDVSSALERDDKSAEFFLIVGPEGGLTSEEGELATFYDYLSVSIGPKVLRSETAALVGAALISIVAASDS